MPGKKLPLWTIHQPQHVHMLRTQTEALPVATITTPAIQQLIANMVTTMYAAKGVGLAAPQIGQSIRLTVIDGEIADRPLPLVLINPAIVSQSSAQRLGEEGCLSIPKVYGLVARALEVKIEAFDQQGQKFTLTAVDLLARVIQHEIDHLQGRLFIDRAESITAGEKYL